MVRDGDEVNRGVGKYEPMPYQMKAGNPFVPEERCTQSIGDAATEQEYDSRGRKMFHHWPNCENRDPTCRQIKAERKAGGSRATSRCFQL